MTNYQYYLFVYGIAKSGHYVPTEELVPHIGKATPENYAAFALGVADGLIGNYPKQKDVFNNELVSYT